MTEPLRVPSFDQYEALVTEVTNLRATITDLSNTMTAHLDGHDTSPPPGPEPVYANRPPQPVLYHYGRSNIGAYVKPGALAITIERDEDQSAGMKAIAAEGGAVLTYLDPIIDNSYGRYHELLHRASEFGPATTRWPGNYKANYWGYLADFRIGSILQSKWERVLERVVAECPHISGFFLDDVGSRSWFAGVPWGSIDRMAYRLGAIEIVKVARRVADRHDMVVMVNGTWGAGSLSAAGGGYPDMNRHGCSMAEGGMVENHPTSELPYWTDYCTSGQWASDASTGGMSFMISTNRTAAERRAYCDAGIVAFAESSEETAWGPFHPTGL